jgi:hypothetical protein
MMSGPGADSPLFGSLLSSLFFSCREHKKISSRIRPVEVQGQRAERTPRKIVSQAFIVYAPYLGNKKSQNLPVRPSSGKNVLCPDK